MAQKVFGDVLKRGEEIFQSVSGKLLERPEFAKAMEAAMVGKGKVDAGFATALKQMNVQTRSEFRGLKHRVESLEAQVLELRAALDAQNDAQKDALNEGAKAAAAVKPPAARARAPKAAKKA